MQAAILIDPHMRMLTMIELPVNAEGDADYEAIRHAVFGDGERGLLQAVNIGAGHSMFIDEEGLLMDWEKQAFFQLGRPPACHTFAGRAVILRDTDEGGTSSCLLPLALVAGKTVWLDPREVDVPAPVLITQDERGNEEVTLLAGVERWTYGNQPT